jgi:Flp pilus assembly protein TadB
MMSAVTIALVLAALMAAAWPWLASVLGQLPIVALVAAGVGALLIVVLVARWHRHRERRRLVEMRDSALW